MGKEFLQRDALLVWCVPTVIDHHVEWRECAVGDHPAPERPDRPGHRSRRGSPAARRPDRRIRCPPRRSSRLGQSSPATCQAIRLNRYQFPGSRRGRDAEAGRSGGGRCQSSVATSRCLAPPSFHRRMLQGSIGLVERPLNGGPTDEAGHRAANLAPFCRHSRVVGKIRRYKRRANLGIMGAAGSYLGRTCSRCGRILGRPARGIQHLPLGGSVYFIEGRFAVGFTRWLASSPSAVQNDSCAPSGRPGICVF